jgi:preprotein translocase subunit SecF
VRENLQIKSKQTYTQILDTSITDDIVPDLHHLADRALLRPVSVFIGEGTISDFALVMLVGMISGAYSTIYMPRGGARLGEAAAK